MLLIDIIVKRWASVKMQDLSMWQSRILAHRGGLGHCYIKTRGAFYFEKAN